MTDRVSTLRISLHRALDGHAHKNVVKTTLDDISKKAGVIRHYVSLVANAVVLQKIEAGEPVPLINTTFYNQLWTAVEASPQTSDEYSEFVGAYIDHQHPAALPDFDLRQHVTKEMAKASSRTIENVIPRMKAYIHFRLRKFAQDRTELLAQLQTASDHVRNKLASMVAKCIQTTDLDRFREAESVLTAFAHNHVSLFLDFLHGFIGQQRAACAEIYRWRPTEKMEKTDDEYAQKKRREAVREKLAEVVPSFANFKKTVRDGAVNRIYGMVITGDIKPKAKIWLSSKLEIEWTQFVDLGDAVRCMTFERPEKRQKKDESRTGGVGFEYALNSKRLEVFLPYLHRIGCEMEEACHVEGVKKYETLQEMRNEDNVVEITRAEWRRLNTPATKTTSFSLLPIFVLQPAFVRYDKLQIESLTKLLPSGAVSTSIPSIDELFPGLARLGRNEAWSSTSFTTDGYALCYTMRGSEEDVPSSKNTPHLPKAGYAIPAPLDKVDLREQKRGVFLENMPRGKGKAHDLMELSQLESEQVYVCSVDPGSVLPVANAEGIASLGMSPLEAAKETTTWCVDHDTYMRQSGRATQRQENLRRSKKKEYKRAIGSFRIDPIRIKITDQTKKSKRQKHFSRPVCKRTCNAEEFKKYCSIRFEHMATFVRETQRTSKRRIKFYVRRKTQSFLDDVANRMLGKANVPAHAMRWEEDSPRKRAELIQALRESQERRKSLKSVVFFGGGSFRGTRGRATVPKKSLVKAIAHTGVCIIIGEDCTSCKCGGCGGKIVDTDKTRIRSCENYLSGKPCPLFDHLQNSADRDQLASWNIHACACCAIQGLARPTTLSRDVARRPALLT